MNDAVYTVERTVKQQVRDRFMEVKQATSLDIEDYYRNHGSAYRSRIADLAREGVLRKARNPDGTLLKWRQEGFPRQVWEIVPGKRVTQ